MGLEETRFLRKTRFLCLMRILVNHSGKRREGESGSLTHFTVCAVCRRICPKCAAVFNVKSNPPAVDGVCDRCGAGLVQRDDDREETVRNRLKVYMEQTSPLLEHFRTKGNLVDIDGSAGIEGVFDQMVEAIDGLSR